MLRQDEYLNRKGAKVERDGTATFALHSYDPFDDGVEVLRRAIDKYNGIIRS